MVAIADRLALGDLDQRIDCQSSDEIGDLARSFGRMIESQRDFALAADRVASGDLTQKICPRSEADELAKSMMLMVTTFRGVVEEMGLVSQAAVAGLLGSRGDAAKFQGGYREIIQVLNATLDAILAPVNEAGAVLEKVANRDLTARMQGRYTGDHAKLKESLDQAVENLAQSLQRVAGAVEEVASAAGEIGRGSQALAQGASEQASSLEEVSSSLVEMSSMTRQNAGNTKEALGLAEATRAAATKGLESMGRLSGAIERIKTSSDSTAKIVKTIDEIAFQTNLLALNAAVEAARAGDAGKGFAVVAEEVRNLAMRSAEAAKRTADLIEESIRNAESGVALNGEVLSALREIAGQANKVGEVMAEITVRSEQQNQGIEQITEAMDQVNQVTQQNAANSEESASAAEELSSQAEGLRVLVSRFRLGEGDVRVEGFGLQEAAGAPRLGLVRGKGARAVLDPEKVIPFHDAGDRAVLGNF
jgi:methyl-accepting chemotaxis protein